MTANFVKKALVNAIPHSRRTGARRLWHRIKYFGIRRKCPVCESHLRLFLPHVSGGVSRPDADCPVCGVSERHRLTWLYFRAKTNLFESNLSMLHIAPEPEVSKRLSREPRLKYMTGDIRPGAMMEMDIAQIPLNDASIDVIYCCHVLNMVPDDLKAMSELCRILSPDGWALLQVPIRDQSTLECLKSSSPDERMKAFGYADMFRIYGPDFKERLEKAGFYVTVDDFFETLTNDDRSRYGLKDEKLVICRKQIAKCRKQ